MSHPMRIFWLITLIFFTAGCSGYQVACYTRTEGALEPGQGPGEICDLNPGDNVRLVLVDGIQVRGKVMTISSKELVLEQEDQSKPFQVYSSDQIYSIETESSGGGNSTATSLLVVGGIVLIVGAAILAKGMSDLNNMFEQ